MESREYLDAILPDDGGRYYVLAIKGKKGKRYEHVVDTIAQVELLVETYGQQQLNVYVATSSLQPDATVREDALGLGKNCVFFDLDVGEGKNKLPDKKAALQGMADLIGKTGMPRPSFTVDSGHGIHVYWLLSETVTKAEWQPITDGLHALAMRHGLPVDPIGKQMARLMRVPGTLNTKLPGEYLPCYVRKSHDLSYSLDDFREVIPADHNVIPMTTLPSSLAGETGLGTTSHFAPRHAANIIEQCDLLASAVETGGANHEEPLWNGLLGLLAGCEDGEEYAHKIGHLHPGYSHKDTTYKFGRRVTVLDAGKAGTTTCQYLHDHGGDEKCQACPHWIKRQSGVEMGWTSPTALGLPPKEEIDWHNFLPFGLKRAEISGHAWICQEVDSPTDDGMLAPYIQGDVTNFKVFNVGGEIMYAFNWTAGGGRAKTHHVKLRLADTKSPDTIDVALGNQNVPVLTPHRANWVILMRAWHQQLESNRLVHPANPGMGWVSEHGEHGFRVGPTTYWGNDRAVATPVGDAGFASDYSPHGTLPLWRAATEAALRAEHIETNAIIATAFAAPIVEMLPIEGALISAVSRRSGTGKTLALQIGQSVWGNPKNTFAFADTANSVMGRMAQLRNLPGYWDEIRLGGDPRVQRQFIQMLFQITGGREKARMNQKAELRELGSWETLVVCTSNFGLAEAVQTQDGGMTAGLNRVLEFQVAALDDSKRCRPEELRPINTNYGVAGVEYAKWLSTHRKQCQLDVTEVYHKLEAKLGSTAEERFSLASLVGMYLGAKWAKDASIIDLDSGAILKFLIQAFLQQRTAIEEVSETNTDSEHGPANIVAMYMQEHQRAIAQIRVQPRRGHTVPDNNVLDAGSQHQSTAAVLSHDGTLTIPAGSLNLFMKGRGVTSPKGFIDQLAGCVEKRCLYPALTDSTTSRQRCYVITRTTQSSYLFPDDDSPDETSE